MLNLYYDKLIGKSEDYEGKIFGGWWFYARYSIR